MVVERDDFLSTRDSSSFVSQVPRESSAPPNHLLREWVTGSRDGSENDYLGFATLKQKTPIKTGVSKEPPVACTPTCENEFLNSCVPFHVTHGSDSNEAYLECRQGIDKLSSTALIEAGCLQHCSSTEAMVASKRCTPSCESEFRSFCMPFFVAQGWDTQKAYDICRSQIDTGSSERFQRAGCVKTCEASREMFALADGDNLVLAAGEVTEDSPQRKVSLDSIQRVGVCSFACEREFVLRCVPFHKEQGWKANIAFTACRSAIDNSKDELKKAGCRERCDSTQAMLDAREDQMDKQCETEHAHPRSIVRTSTEANNTNTTLYGMVVLVGDSALDGCGKTGGVVEWSVSRLLGTTVVNNAEDGADMNAIFRKQTACSAIEDCKWSVVIGGMNRNTGRSDMNMVDFVEREVRAGKKVIIHGHPNPTPWDWYHQNKFWAALLDGYEKIAAMYDDVFFIDPRKQPEWRKYADVYDVDQFHPGVKGGQVFAQAIASVITTQSRNLLAKDSQLRKVGAKPAMRKGHHKFRKLSGKPLVRNPSD